MPDAGQYVEIGEIPAGKHNVQISMSTETQNHDLDLCLFDKDFESGLGEKWPNEGAAIVNYCATTGCNLGKGGWLPGREEITWDRNDGSVSPAMELVYSGYNGVNNWVGNEYI